MAKRKSEIDQAQDLAAGGGSMEQIREILFGGVQRSHDSRMAKIESLIDRNAKESANRLNSSQTEIERKLSEGIKDLTDKLEKLGASLAVTEKSAKEELAATSKELLGRIASLDDRLGSDLKSESDRLQAHIETLRDDVDQAVDRLEDQKTDRADLGDLLIEMGMRIKGDATLDAIKSGLNGSKADGAAQQE